MCLTEGDCARSFGSQWLHQALVVLPPRAMRTEHIVALLIAELSARPLNNGDNSLVGSIVGAINGGQAQGRAVRIPGGSLLTFRVQQPVHGEFANHAATGV
jgi:hypothetical protein